MPMSILTKVVLILLVTSSSWTQSKNANNASKTDPPAFSFEQKVEVPFPSQQVWKTVNQFDKLEWIPMVDNVIYSFDPKSKRSFRQVKSKNGWTLGELKTLSDEKNKVLSFEVIHIQDPNQNFVRAFRGAKTSIQVIPVSPQSCQVIWKTSAMFDSQHPQAQKSEFTLDQIKNFFEITSRSGLEYLRVKKK
jgi:hypothetical protein